MAIATGQRVECLLLDGGTGTLSPLAAWEYEQQVSAVAVLEVPDSEGSGSQVSPVTLAAVAMLASNLLLTATHTSLTQPCSVFACMRPCNDRDAMPANRNVARPIISDRRNGCDPADVGGSRAVGHK